VKTYLEISISATTEQRELLIPTMVELGCEGFQETDSALLCYADKDRWSDDAFLSFQKQLRTILQTISVNAVISFREIVDENWNAQWEKTIQPIEIGKRIVIKPSWTDYANIDGRVVVEIDPKMSFGTGYHETTRLTLQLIEKHIRPNIAMLDVGTGTGVLAIAAVKLGAASAVGIDNDEWSIENANENVLANHVEKLVTISDSTLSSFSSITFDLIAANLTLNTNAELLPDFHRLLRNDGILLLSGLLAHDRETMLQHLTQKFERIEELTENEWIAIAVRKKK
jgi:ribosomal protein L11 methyltransferase